MTLRAVILGLIGAVAIAGLGYINDQVLQLESMTAGHLLPITVLAPLIVALVTVNPLLGLLRRSWRFGPPEVATIVLVMFVACSIPGRGLMQDFTPSLALPAYYNRITPGWQARGMMDYVPPRMMPAGGKYDPRATQGFLQGLAPAGETLPLSEVPWQQWRDPLLLWGPLAALTAVAVVCLGLIVHRQWSAREHLRYPIAELAGSLMRQDGRAIGPIFRRKAFWIALSVVLGIHLVNGIQAWHPGSVAVPLEFSFGSAYILFPWMQGPDWGTNLLVVRLYPTVIAFSFFLASDITLSLGLSQWLYVPLASSLIWAGVDMSSDYMAGGSVGWQRFGSYLGFAVMLVYVGRRYYRDVLAAAVTFRPRRGVQGYEAWAFRILVAALVAMAAMLIGIGLDWPLAILTVGLLMVTFLVVSRVSAETGLFMVHPRWQALGVFFGLFGYYALGPQDAIIVGVVCAVLSIDPSQSLMPYFQNALKAADDLGVRPGRAGWAAGATYVVCLAVAVPVALWANYNFRFTMDDFTGYRVPTMAFRATEKAIDELDMRDDLDQSRSLSPLGRLWHMRPKTDFLWFAGAGFALVVGVGLLRLRCHWWPLHPVIFLVWSTWPMVMFCHSFLLGCAAKSVVVRFGGYSAFTRAKTAMLGVIAGDLLGGAVFIAVGAIYHAVTGVAPIRYQIFPL